ncbi:uncharacterized protein LOC117781960 [Drosophila innubila]|uniref:uncharacterized protein LOC117781960 n=1 Tax=Drosophila innubila TaxID=198719 RepID=UPI00148C20B4|nr:uncharacterized protein LOC117781960 [Drosophila innubila]
MPLWGASRRFREEDDAPITLGQVMDDNFACMSRMAKSMCLTLGRPKDRLICRNTLEELAKFNKSESIQVKQNVRKFMRFYLQVLRWTQTHQPSKIYEKWYGDACNGRSDRPTGADKDETYIWLEEGRSYLAMKQFEDGSTMIYSAVAKDPGAGWVDNGIKTLASQVGN